MRREQQAGRARPGRRLTLLALQAGIVAASVGALGLFQSRTLLAAGVQAPSFTATTLGGEPYSLEALRGQRVILHFWATWCGVCRGEVGMLNELYEARPPGTELIAVVAADASDPAALAQFVEEQGIQYPVLLGSRGVFTRFQVRGLPTNYFLDPSLRIRSGSVGMSTRWGMRWRAGW